MSSNSSFLGDSQTAQFDFDFAQLEWFANDPVTDATLYAPEAQSLKRHPSQELEDSRQPKILRVAGTSTTTWSPSPLISMAEVHSLDDSIITAARDYMSRKQQPYHDAKIKQLGFTLYRAFLSVICDFPTFEKFLDYRNENAQVLVDAMQDLLDNGFMEQQDRRIFIVALAALAVQSQLFPKRFISNNVTYQKSEVEEKYGCRIVKGSMKGEPVRIVFDKISHWKCEDWMRELVLWAQLSHENVVPFYGLCPIDDNDFYPGLVSPWLEDVESLMDGDPDFDRRTLISEVAAGMAYLHGSGSIHGGRSFISVFISNTVPPRALLQCSHHHEYYLPPGLVIDPEVMDLFPVDDRDNFLGMLRRLNLSNDKASPAHDVKTFSRTCCSIFTYRLTELDEPDDSDSRISIRERPYILCGYVREGLDDHMRQLLLDCYVKDLGARPTAREIVWRLEEGNGQWGIALTSQERETNFIASSAMAYKSSLNHLHRGIQVTNQAYKLYRAFLDVFRNLTLYTQLLSCRSERAQDLIDAMQALLDDGVVEQHFRNVFILTLAALASRSRCYPKRFVLHTGIVTYQESEVEVDSSRVVKGFMERQPVNIIFEARKPFWQAQYWFSDLILRAQLSHENVLASHGLVGPVDNKDHFPGLVTPQFQHVHEFLKSNPDPATRRSIISDVAAGMAYLHSNGLVHGSIYSGNILITETAPFRALLVADNSETLMVGAIDPMSEVLWLDNDMDNFLQIHRRLAMFTRSDWDVSRENDVYDFSRVAFKILTGSQPSFTRHEFIVDNFYKNPSAMPVVYLNEGLDEYMRKLLQDCRMNDSKVTLTAQEVVERLGGAWKQWEMAIRIQKHETNSIVESAGIYLSLKRSDSGPELIKQASKLYYSFLDVFQNFAKYVHFLNCRSERAQILIDTMQALLDDGVVEQQFRNIFILGLTALALHSQLYPTRVTLHNVTYQELVTVEETDIFSRTKSCRIAKGFRDGETVRLEFVKRSSVEEQSWVRQVILRTQLSHKNVLPLHGLCLIHDEDYFPGLVSPWSENGDADKFLESNPDAATRRSLISDVAAGMAYLFGNSVILPYYQPDHKEKIFITDTVPPHACLNNAFDIDIDLGDGFDVIWPDHDEGKYLRMHHKLCEDPLMDSAMEEDVMRESFARTAYWILTKNCNAKPFEEFILNGKHPINPFEQVLPLGFDNFMRQLLVDCYDSDTSLTLQQIVERLEQEERRKLTQSKVSSLLGVTFENTCYYRCLLSCNEADAQKLLDAFQLVLDTENFQDRKQLIAAIQRLSTRTGLFPLHFLLDGPLQATMTVPAASGSFADIHRVNFQGEETCFKVIRVNKKTEVGKHISKVYAKEAIVWAQLSHPNILPFYGIAELRSRLSFVTRWATNGHIGQYLSRNPDANRVLLCTDTAAGVEYLHNNDIVHGDLKGCNILIDCSGRASLGDFGLSSVTDPEIIKWTSQSTMASKGGTIRWQAPELHESEDTVDEVYNTKASDIYAWASVCYEIFTGHHPFFEVSNAVTVMSKIMQGHIPTRPDNDDPAWLERGLNIRIWELMEECWSFKPSERPNMTQVISKLNVESPIDLRPPAEWGRNDSMRFRNARNANLSDNLIPFWKDLESLLLQVIPGIQDTCSQKF